MYTEIEQLSKQGVGLGEPGFSLLEWEIIDKLWKEGRMIHVVTDKS